MHLANGALFGAVYANAAPRAAGARGRCAGRWPGSPSTSRPGPAPPRCRACTPPPTSFPQLWGSGRAFAQATWRHLLFGTVLGELERRLNPPDSEPQPDRPGRRRLQRPRLRRVRRLAQLTVSRRGAASGAALDRPP